MTKFTRNTKDVKDITKLSQNVLEENDIVSTVDGKVYIKRKSDYIEVGGSGASEDVEQLKTDITNLKSSNTKLTNRIKALETPTPSE